MRQFFIIASNAFMELIRQPIFLLLMTTSVSFEVFLSCVSYFGFGDEPKLIKISVLAVMLLAGLFSAVMTASSSVGREIRTGTALAVLSKPVSKTNFLLAKFAGLAAALTLSTYVNMIGALLASRMSFDAYGEVDKQALSIFAGCLVLAYAVAGFTNYFLRRPFMADAVLCVVVLVTISFVIVAMIGKQESQFSVGGGKIDWRLIPASILVLFAVWLLAGLALACSTRLEMVPTLAVCSALFLLGLMSDYWFGRRAEMGTWWASTLYTLTPNWQLFWLADVLESGKAFPWSYVGKAFGYVACYVGALLALALLLFEDRELS